MELLIHTTSDAARTLWRRVLHLLPDENGRALLDGAPYKAAIGGGLPVFIYGLVDEGAPTAAELAWQEIMDIECAVNVLTGGSVLFAAIDRQRGRAAVARVRALVEAGKVGDLAGAPVVLLNTSPRSAL